ncbi:MAG: sulfate adenylyltransferase subunit CysD [Alphaproteobacteria bacterium]|nr:sulfate adenylyltransferase subunit CysD [Alphaproteobacteria bacterium]
MTVKNLFLSQRLDAQARPLPWDTEAVCEAVFQEVTPATRRAAERLIEKSALLPAPLTLEAVRDETGDPLKVLVQETLMEEAKRKRILSLCLQWSPTQDGQTLLLATDARQARKWLFLKASPSPEEIYEALGVLSRYMKKNLLIWPHADLVEPLRLLVQQKGVIDFAYEEGRTVSLALTAYGPGRSVIRSMDAQMAVKKNTAPASSKALSHLDLLEAQSIHIIREVMAEARNPVMLYSIGKDSAVMLHLARKAFYPAPPPFPLLHVDTGWKFQEMYKFRDQMAARAGMDLIIHINPEGVEKGINPFDHGSALHTDIMKTQGLKQALDHYGFDAAFGGARRDEEKSRAKERVFSFRTKTHHWDPKNQRPELWDLYNGRKHEGESMRVFPLSNWTELDIWQYIYREKIPIVPLYFAAVRPVVARQGALIMVDDHRFPLLEGEKVMLKKVRFRTLGCYPLTGAIESEAKTLEEIILELLAAKTSERQGRLIDSDSAASMEKKKQEGYF